ncbi:MAG: TdeIII family type II restriction endonuclease [Pseudolabrys sp.]
MDAVIDKDRAIRGLVEAAVQSYATGFEARHVAQKDDPDGVINMKVHNVFIAALGPDIQYYSALVRSLDSSLGDMLEGLAISIAKLSYSVSREVVGYLSGRQTQKIARLLEEYKRRVKRPEISDYALLIDKTGDSDRKVRHDSDYYLKDDETGRHYLIELKIGGDLDNKKARAEKEALLEQYAILCNSLGAPEKVSIRFATAYNRFGEGKPWEQGRVKQYFAPEELLIGRDFWDFVCKSQTGYETVLDEYRAHAHLIIQALNNVKVAYLS